MERGNGSGGGDESRLWRAGGGRFLDDDIIVFYAHYNHRVLLYALHTFNGDDAIRGRETLSCAAETDPGRPRPTTPLVGFTPNVDALNTEFIGFFFSFSIIPSVSPIFSVSLVSHTIF